jgi:preprotein translocase subunit SecF
MSERYERTPFHIDFMRYRPFFLFVSLFFIVASLILLGTKGLRKSIDFTGGLLLRVHFAGPVSVGKVRAAMERIGLGDSTIQEYGSPRDILIRIAQERAEALARARGLQGELSIEAMLERLIPEIQQSLYRTFAPDLPTEKPDFNNTDAVRLTRFLTERDPLGLQKEPADVREARYGELARKIYEVRMRPELGGVLRDWKPLFDAVPLEPPVRALLRDHFVLGPFTILSVESVGPQIGKELIRKTQTAVIVSMVLMLIYIWFRFDLVFGVMALACLVHDVLITLGAMALTGREISLTVVAALLTIVGYDVNDTIVVYDRIRENKGLRKYANILELYNASLNQTLPRTILTSLTVLFVVVVLYFFGGTVLNDFAFVMIVGVIAGTYSSIYIACSLASYWYQWRQRRAEALATAAPQKPTRVKTPKAIKAK